METRPPRDPRNLTKRGTPAPRPRCGGGEREIGACVLGATEAPPPPRARPQTDVSSGGGTLGVSTNPRSGFAHPLVIRQSYAEGGGASGFLAASPPRAAAFPAAWGAWPGRGAYKGGR